MIGAYPTVGLIILLDGISLPEATQRIFERLDPLIPQDSWQHSHTNATSAQAKLGNIHLPAIQHSFELQNASTIFLDFDEDQVVHLSRSTAISITELLTPYVAVLETVPDCYAIGLGFELSPPSGMEEQTLKEAGIALLFMRDKEDKIWRRKELLPMIGHYL